MTQLVGRFAVILLLLAATAGFGATLPGSGFNASFVQTRTLPGFKTPIVSRGKMRVDPRSGFYWEVDSPYHYVFAMRDGHVREELPDGTVRTLKPDEKPWLAAVEHIFVGALAGNRAELERYFNIAIAPLAKGRRVTLTPKPGALAKVIERIRVTESAPGQPQNLEIREVSGGRMDIRFTPIPGKP
ncbi:MAG TPA: outer membrane lipoprotein carrier protein LolA [Gammaproteobacteria bacterium]|nr:outer membrane lipoprotein carrier protein LolA [Gammaproteobacteria bacterium]